MKTEETLEEAAKLALLFHNTYEKLAPSFSYETRQDTKEFDFKSNNGKLMVAVCAEILKWQQEQMYSEEEVNLLHKSIIIHLDDSEAERMINQIFKQFKKLDCQHQFTRTGDSFDLTIYCKKCGINYKNK